jgi:hypothetical protein
VKPPAANRRSALTLFELVVASTLMTVVVTAAAVVLRGAHGAWSAHEADLNKLESAHATLRHLVRNLRQATGVVSITLPANTSGAISLSMPSGQTLAWAHVSVSNLVNYGVTTATSLLADGIEQLVFTAYKADGVTQTSVAAEIQLVKCTVRVTLPRDSGGTRDLSAWAWVRSW